MATSGNTAALAWSINPPPSTYTEVKAYYQYAGLDYWATLYLGYRNDATFALELDPALAPWRFYIVTCTQFVPCDEAQRSNVVEIDSF